MLFYRYIILSAFIVSICYARNAQSQWARMTLGDLNATYKLIKENHPGPYDRENHEFKDWLEKGYQLAKQQAKHVDSFAGYKYTLKKYANGFHDEHLNLSIKVDNIFVEWPGFIIARKENIYKVGFVSPKLTNPPEMNDELISCDDLLISKALKNNVFPFFGNPKLPSDYIKFSPYLLIDSKNPFINRPSVCKFSSKKRGEYLLTLQWSKIRKSLIGENLKKVVFGERPAISFEEFSKNSYWITISTSDPNEIQEIKLKNIINTIQHEREKIQQAKVIVVDVRGNTGGSSQWGVKFTEAIWGKQFVESRQRDYGTYIEWRASPGNYAHLKSTFLNNESESYQGWKRIVLGMKVSIDNNEPLYKEYEDTAEKKKIKKERLNNVTANVFFLTDGHCVSACLDFADLILAMPNVIHIGFHTSADTNYLETRGFKLPSKIANLSVATKVYRNRKRASGYYYTPKYFYPGDVNDEKAIKEWVLSCLDRCNG